MTPLLFLATQIFFSAGQYELRSAQNVVLRDVLGVPIRAATIEGCMDAAQAYFARSDVPEASYRCVHTGAEVKVIGKCDTVMPAPTVDAEGFTVEGDMEGQLCAGSETRYRFLQVKWVEKPYPVCHVQEKVEKYPCEPLVHDLAEVVPQAPEPVADPMKSCERYELLDEGCP